MSSNLLPINMIVYFQFRHFEKGEKSPFLLSQLQSHKRTTKWDCRMSRFVFNDVDGHINNNNNNQFIYCLNGPELM